MNTPSLVHGIHELSHPAQRVPDALRLHRPSAEGRCSVADPVDGEDSLQSDRELRAAFDDFVGQTFFGHLLKAMRETVDKPAYFHGGRTEEVFQGQLDQVLVEHISDASAETFTEPMFELFTMARR